MKDFLIDNRESDKEIFVKYYDYIKIKSTRNKNIEYLHEVETTIKNEAIRREHKMLLKLAIDFCEISNAINLSCINWDNIKRSVKLYRKVNQSNKINTSEYIETLKNNVWEKNMSCHRYNIVLTDLLKMIKSTLEVSADISLSEFDTIWKNIESLSPEDKMAILSKLANELKISLSESHL